MPSDAALGRLTVSRVGQFFFFHLFLSHFSVITDRFAPGDAALSGTKIGQMRFFVPFLWKRCPETGEIPAADGIEGAADHLERDIPAADQDRRNGNTY